MSVMGKKASMLFNLMLDSVCLVWLKFGVTIIIQLSGIFDFGWSIMAFNSSTYVCIITAKILFLASYRYFHVSRFTLQSLILYSMEIAAKLHVLTVVKW